VTVESLMTGVNSLTAFTDTMTVAVDVRAPSVAVTTSTYTDASPESRSMMADNTTLKVVG